MPVSRHHRRKHIDLISRQDVESRADELDDADDDAHEQNSEARVVGKPCQDELLVGETVLVTHAPAIIGLAGKHAAQLIPCLLAHVEYVAPLAFVLRRHGSIWSLGRRRLRLGTDGFLIAHSTNRGVLASEELASEPFRIVFGDVGNDDGLVVGTAGRVDVERAHAGDALQKRRLLVDRLHLVVRHVHAFLGDDATIEIELVGAQDVVQALVGQPVNEEDDTGENEKRDNRNAGR